jgi:RNA polymerase sigma-70 factor (family 1)
MAVKSIYTEQQALEKLADSSEVGFRKIYDLYFERVAAYIYKLCKTQLATEELTQETFIKFWMSSRHFHNASTAEPFLFTIAKNLVIDYWRKLARETKFKELLLHDSLTVEHPNGAQNLEVADLQKLIDEALAGLSLEKRRIFILRTREEMSSQEIADSLNLAKSTVKNHFSESLKHVRSHLSETHNKILLFNFLLLLIEDN